MRRKDFRLIASKLLEGQDHLFAGRERLYVSLTKKKIGLPRGTLQLIASSQDHLVSAAFIELLNRMPKEDFKIVKKHFSFKIKPSELRELLRLNVSAHLICSSSQSFKLHKLLYTDQGICPKGILICRKYMAMTRTHTDCRLSLLDTLQSLHEKGKGDYAFPARQLTKLLFRKSDIDEIFIDSIAHKLLRCEKALRHHSANWISTHSSGFPVGSRNTPDEDLAFFSKRGGVKIIFPLITSDRRSQSIRFLSHRETRYFLKSFMANNVNGINKSLVALGVFKKELSDFASLSD